MGGESRGSWGWFVASSHFRDSGEGALLPPAAAAPEQSSIITTHLPPPKIKLRNSCPNLG